MNVYLILFLVILIFLLYKNYIENFNTKNIKFLHIPKTAGTYIKRNYNLKLYNHFQSYPTLSTINIACIRNPYTRLQSIFAHIKDRDEYKNRLRSYDLLNFKNLDDLAKAYYNKKHKFHNKAKDLLKWNRKKFRLYKKLKNNNGCSVNEKIKACIHWAPQFYYIYGYDAKVNYLLKYENLDDELLKLEELDILKKKKNITSVSNKIMVSSKKHKELAYETPIIKRLVEDVYKKDIKLWKKAGLDKL